MNYPLGISGSFMAGGLSALLGVGGGPLKVPLMSYGMRVPFKVASATSNLMIGVTGAASVASYAWRGHVKLGLVSPLVVGVLAGAYRGQPADAARCPRRCSRSSSRSCCSWWRRRCSGREGRDCGRACGSERGRGTDASACRGRRRKSGEVGGAGRGVTEPAEPITQPERPARAPGRRAARWRESGGSPASCEAAR